MNQLGCGSDIKQTNWSLAIQELNSQVEELKNRVGVLASRIDPLLAPEKPSNVKTPGQPIAPKSKAINEIDSVSFRLSELHQVIQEMIARLEI